jgi:peroxiredoxin
MKFALLALLALPFIGLRADPVPPKPAPGWTLKDLDGKDVRFDAFKGKVVVLDFWATWCPPCVGEVPRFVGLQRKYAQDGLVVVGVSVDSNGPGPVRAFATKHGVNYPMLMANDQIISAFGGVDSFPTTYIIDREGKIRDRKVGAVSPAQFEKTLVGILREKSAGLAITP